MVEVGPFVGLPVGRTPRRTEAGRPPVLRPGVARRSDATSPRCQRTRDPSPSSSVKRGGRRGRSRDDVKELTVFGLSSSPSRR